MARSLASPPQRGDETSRLREQAGIAGRPDENVRSAATDAAIYTGALYAAQGILFLAGLIHRALLGPLGTGYWALMQSAWPFFALASLGVHPGTTRQIPFHRGKGDYATAAAVANSGNSFSLLAMAVLGTIVSAVALVFGGSWAPELRWGLVLLGLTAPLRFLGDCHETLFHATKRFSVVSAATVMKAVVALTLQTLFVYLFGFYGMFAGVAAASVAVLVLWNRMGLTGFRRPAFSFSLETSRLRELIAFGLPILVFSQVWVLFMSIDNLIVAAYIDVESLGYYALAVSVTGYVLHLPNSIGTALFPRMSERFGRTGDMASLRHYATDVQQLLAYMLVPVFIGGAYFLLPVLIRQALPAFGPAVPVVQIMVAGSFFIALCSMPIKMLLTAGRRLPLILLVVVCLAVNAAANFGAVVVLDWGIEGAAFATAFSYLVVFLVTTGYGLGQVLGARPTLAHVGELLLAFAYLAGALWAIDTVIGPGGGSPAHDVLIGAAKFACFLVTLLPGLVLVQVRHRALTTVRGLLTSALRKVRSPRSGSGRPD